MWISIKTRSHTISSIQHVEYQGGARRRYYISYLQATAAAPDHQSSDLLVRASIAAASITSTMASLFFSTPVDIDVVLEDLDERQTVDVKLDKGRRERVPLYMDGESVKGAVTIRPKDGKRLEHTGIKVQFIGTIGAWELSSSLPRLNLPSLTPFSEYRDVLRPRQPL